MYKKSVFIFLLWFLILSPIFAKSLFKDIKFKGLSQISQTVAYEISNFKKDELYSEEQINNTLKKFYDFGYFKDIVVSVENNILIFDFIEKPFIVNIEMSGYKTRKEDLEELYDEIGIHKGNMYSTSKIKKVKKRLLLKLEQEGYINSVVEVEVKHISTNSVAIKFLVNKGKEVIIRKINYNGAKQLDIDDFEDVMINKQKESFSWWFGRNDGVIDFEQLEYDKFRIKQLYLENGFLDIRVKNLFSTVDFNTNSANINISIYEGAQYKINNIIVHIDNNITKTDKIYKHIKLKKEKIFNVDKLRKDIEYIKTVVADDGFAFAEVKYDIKKDTKNNTADVVYNVISKDKVYINDVIISGNNRTLDRVIRRNIYLAPGDLYNLTDFKDSQNALNRTGFFETVKIERQKVSENKMNLLVTVSEAPTGNLILGGGYGSYDGFMINASVNDKNIFGSGLDLGFAIDWSKKQTNYNISLNNPAINDSKYSGSFSAHKKDREITYTNYKLKTKSTGVSVGIGKSLTRHLHTGARYSYDKISDTYDTKPQDNKEYVISSITPYINFNNTDNYFIPRSGMIASTSLEIAGIGGDVNYLKSSTVYKYFKGLEDYWDFDAIIRYRAILRMLKSSGYAPQSNTFYLGGVNSLRGYKSYAFGPKTDEEPYERMFANSIEFNFPLIPSAKMRWGVFYDYGMIGQTSFTQIKRSGTGALIEWISPVGPILFVFSHAINDKEGDATSNFEFSLGSRF